MPEAAQQGHTVFDPLKSPTFKFMKDARFQISYGDSSYATGLVGTDTVDIGGATVKNQAIGIPLELSQSLLEDESTNGLVGLGFSSTSTIESEEQPTFFDNVARTLDEPVLTASLKSDSVGEYEFGVVDHAKYQGPMANISVNASNGYWQFPSTQFAVGDKPVQAIKEVPTAIADTGTSLLMVSPEVVEAYYAKVNGSVSASGAGGYIYPCKSELPDLSIAAGGTMAVIPGSMLNFSTLGTNTTTGEPGKFLVIDAGSILEWWLTDGMQCVSAAYNRTKASRYRFSATSFLKRCSLFSTVEGHRLGLRLLRDFCSFCAYSGVV